jgi:predicted nucleotidyltransferase
MGIDEAVISEIVGRVLSAAHPRRIILFGSAATGQMTRDSDIDLLVIADAPRRPACRETPQPGRSGRF